VRLVDSGSLFLIAIFLVLAVTGVFLYTQMKTDEITEVVAEEKPIEILFTAHDHGQPILTFVLFFHPVTMRAAVLDVPADVGVKIPSRTQIDAIGAAFSPEKPDEFRTIIGSLLGREIPFHIVLSREHLSDFIDLLGGVEMFIITDYREMDRVDPLLLPSGNVLLDGRKALDYLMAPPTENGDRELVNRRQGFAQALLRALRKNATFLQDPEVRRIREGLLGSNLDQTAIDSLFRVLGSLDIDTVIRRRIQGTTRVVSVDGEEKELLFPHFEGQWLRQTVNQVQQVISRPGGDEPSQVDVLVEILNGTTTTGLARRTSQLLEDFGFEVVRFANAEDNQTEHTVVIARRGNVELARRVAQPIRCERIVTDPLPEGDVDVTVVLGKDFDGTVVRSESD
jgi:anionic cell wall polymer biosynthesis LytR-Cps2A-Psr (LCP) family protein